MESNGCVGRRFSAHKVWLHIRQLCVWETRTNTGYVGEFSDDLHYLQTYVTVIAGPLFFAEAAEVQMMF